MNEVQRWYTAEEAAQILSERTGVKIAESWIYRRTRLRQIAHHRIGKYVRFSDDDIHAILESTAVRPAASGPAA